VLQRRQMASRSSVCESWLGVASGFSRKDACLSPEGFVRSWFFGKRAWRWIESLDGFSERHPRCDSPTSTLRAKTGTNPAPARRVLTAHTIFKALPATWR